MKTLKCVTTLVVLAPMLPVLTLAWIGYFLCNDPGRDAAEGRSADEVSQAVPASHREPTPPHRSLRKSSVLSV